MRLLERKASQSFFFVALMLVTIVVACGKDEPSDRRGPLGPRRPYSFDYAFPNDIPMDPPAPGAGVVRCNTGRHVLRNQAEYCARLRDNAANNRCALVRRQQVFQLRGCPAPAPAP